MTMQRSIADLEQWRETIRQAQSSVACRVNICGGRGCRTLSSDDLRAALEKELKVLGLGQTRIAMTGCAGFCEQGPLVLVLPQRILYTRVAPQDAADIAKAIRDGTVIERLLYKDPQTDQRVTFEPDVPFYKEQTR